MRAGLRLAIALAGILVLPTAHAHVDHEVVVYVKPAQPLPHLGDCFRAEVDWYNATYETSDTGCPTVPPRGTGPDLGHHVPPGTSPVVGTTIGAETPAGEFCMRLGSDVIPRRDEECHGGQAGELLREICKLDPRDEGHPLPFCEDDP